MKKINVLPQYSQMIVHFKGHGQTDEKLEATKIITNKINMTDDKWDGSVKRTWMRFTNQQMKRIFGGNLLEQFNI